MKLRWIIALIAIGLAATPVVAVAQLPAKIYRVGLLSPGGGLPDSEPRMAALIRGLAQRGYILDRNLAFERRSAQVQLARLPQLVDELTASKVDVIVTISYPAAAAAKQRANGVPVVVTGAGDPVATGLVNSLARPGGDITGMTEVATELSAKRLEVLKDAVPGLKRVAMLWNAADLGMTLRYEAAAAATRALTITVQPLGVREPEDFQSAFAAMEREPPDAILMVADVLTILNRKRVIDFAAAHRLPTIFEVEGHVRDGGLMSYGPDQSETFDRVASLIDRIFKGAKPAELPIELPTRYRFVINLKTAAALGLAIPPTLLARADEVIE
ncbi:MAG: ABC transporter substrate-binding protein [Proteobacteria bacterium]|nr:ABC transporter substrate-binding protein [Pseudomonadota bacterium]